MGEEGSGDDNLEFSTLIDGDCRVVLHTREGLLAMTGQGRGNGLRIK